MDGELLIREIERRDNQQMAIIIRTVFEEFNLPRLGTVYSDPTTDNLYEFFDCDKATCFVAEINGEVVGGGGIYPTEGLPEGFCEFSKFYLLSELRGKGVGKQILVKCIEQARNYGFKNLYLESFPGLEIALRLYKKFGFKSLQQPLGNSGHYACTIWQQLDL